MILSTVRSQPAKDIENEEVVQADRQWMLENLGFVTDEHQICVGITRSRLGLVIVGELYKFWSSAISYSPHYQGSGVYPGLYLILCKVPSSS